jgi:hypothetical protein
VERKSVSNAGKWVVSSNEERWDSGEEFDTYEEARAYALKGFPEDWDLESGDRVFVGQVAEITHEQMAAYAVDVDRVIESIDECLYERVGDEVQNTLPATPEQVHNLGRRLEETIVQWMRDHDLSAPCWSVDHISSHTVPEADE